MNTPLEILKSLKIPTTSYIRAIGLINDPDNPLQLTTDDYKDAISNIIGCDKINFQTEKVAKIHFLYVTQEIIKHSQQGLIPNMEILWKQVCELSTKLIKAQPWCVKEYSDSVEEDYDSEPPKSKKQFARHLYKKHNTFDSSQSSMIELFITKVQLTKPGAVSYFHEFKDLYGFKGQGTKINTTKSKGTKQQQAINICKQLKDASKQEMLSAIMEQTGTSKGGANTYYCYYKRHYVT